VTSRRSTRSTHPTLENAKPLQISFFPSSKAALVRPLSFARLIDVCLSNSILASFHTLSVIRPTPIWNVDDISAFLPIILCIPHFVPIARGDPRSHLCLYVILSIYSPSIVAPGEDEAPNPAEGLDPKVVEVYTKYVSSSLQLARVSLRIIFSPSWMPQSWPAPTKLPGRPASKTVQNHPLTPSMGARSRAHRARAVVVAGCACSDADIRLKYEAAAGPRVPRGRCPRPRARGFRATFDAEGLAQAQPTSI